MDFSLTGPQAKLYRDIVDFAQQELNPGARQRDIDHQFDRELWRKCGKKRLQGLLVPKSLGGLGADPVTAAVGLQALGYGCEDNGLVFGIGAHLLANVVPILKHGSDEQKNRLLPRLCDGSLVAANAMTESDAGSDAFGMNTTAVRNEDGFVISGTKAFITSAPDADVFLVYAITDAEKRFYGGVTAFLVERDIPGLSTGPNVKKMGLRSSSLGELRFDGAFVSPSSVLGEVGAGGPIFAESMDWERALLMAAHVGTMERLLDQGVSFARRRKNRSDSIGRHQAVAHRLADMKVQLEAARMLVFKACSELDVDRQAGLSASIAKLFVAEAFVDITLDTIRTMGAAGYVTSAGVERMLRDAVGSTIYSGTSDIQRNMIARWLGLRPSA